MKEFKGIMITTKDKFSEKIFKNSLLDKREMYSDINYLDLLLEKQKKFKLKKVQQKALSRVVTLVVMNQQICEGGVKQYYEEGYDEGRCPSLGHNCFIYDKNKITSIYKSELLPLVETIYGKESYATNTLKNLSIMWDCIRYVEPEGPEDTFVPFLVNDDSFERTLYHFYEYDTILKMYAEYTYKKYFK